MDEKMNEKMINVSITMEKSLLTSLKNVLKTEYDFEVSVSSFIRMLIKKEIINIKGEL